MHCINYKCICLVPVLLSGSLTAAWILRDATITKEIEVTRLPKSGSNRNPANVACSESEEVAANMKIVQ